jgi:hypothetical protein
LVLVSSLISASYLRAFDFALQSKARFARQSQCSGRDNFSSQSSKQGRISIDVGVGGIAAAGSCFAALPVIRRLRHDRKAGQNTDQ